MLEESIMTESFSERLRNLRNKAGMTQQQLARKMYVDRSTIARWETGCRMPDLILIQRLAGCLGVNVAELIQDGGEPWKASILIIMVDDEKTILEGSMRVLSEVLPEAEVIGFTKPSEAVSFCAHNLVNIAFLDIEMGKISGMDLSDQLLQTDPMINIVFLTAYPDYSLDAWKTNASGFLLKPLIAEDVKAVMGKLRHPLPTAGGTI